MVPKDQFFCQIHLGQQKFSIRPGGVDDRPSKKFLLHFWTFHEAFLEKLKTFFGRNKLLGLF